MHNAVQIFQLLYCSSLIRESYKCDCQHILIMLPRMPYLSSLGKLRLQPVGPLSEFRTVSLSHTGRHKVYHWRAPIYGLGAAVMPPAEYVTLWKANIRDTPNIKVRRLLNGK